jgi:hypothetical protein
MQQKLGGLLSCFTDISSSDKRTAECKTETETETASVDFYLQSGSLVTTAWRVLKLRAEGTTEYIE